MKKYKNYEAIYYILKGSSDNQLKKLYETYTEEEPKPVHIHRPDTIDWAMETVVAMAKSDGLTEEELDIVLDW